jgi:DNA-binding HxlR family transcriptional regulator
MSAALCPRFHKAIELVGSRWTGAVLQVLLSGRARFTDVRDAIPQISDRMLSERLRALEVEGIVLRHVIPESPIRVEYELTEKGRELQASLLAIARWAERWLPEEPGARPDAKPTPPRPASSSGAKPGGAKSKASRRARASA